MSLMRCCDFTHDSDFTDCPICGGNHGNDHGDAETSSAIAAGARDAEPRPARQMVSGIGILANAHG
jgi:hypothetical protein